ATPSVALTSSPTKLSVSIPVPPVIVSPSCCTSNSAPEPSGPVAPVGPVGPVAPPPPAASQPGGPSGPWGPRGPVGPCTTRTDWKPWTTVGGTATTVDEDPSTVNWRAISGRPSRVRAPRSEEHTSELQSRENLVCRLLLEKKK